MVRDFYKYYKEYKRSIKHKKPRSFFCRFFHLYKEYKQAIKKNKHVKDVFKITNHSFFLCLHDTVDYNIALIHMDEDDLDYFAKKYRDECEKEICEELETSKMAHENLERKRKLLLSED